MNLLHAGGPPVVAAGMSRSEGVAPAHGVASAQLGPRRTPPLARRPRGQADLVRSKRLRPSYLLPCKQRLFHQTSPVAYVGE